MGVITPQADLHTAPPDRGEPLTQERIDATTGQLLRQRSP